MISPRLNFSLIKAKFHQLAPAINKAARVRQRRTDPIRLVSNVLGRLRPCWFGKLIPEVSSPHMVSISSLSAELLGFWSRPLLQDSTWTRPGAPEHSGPLIKFPHVLGLSVIILGRRGQVGTGHTGTKRINVLVVKFRQIPYSQATIFPHPTN